MLATVLNVLIISKLIKFYLTLQKDIFSFKSYIKKGAKTKTNKITKKHNPYFIYGAYLFNPTSSKLFINNKTIVINATTHIINELDTIYYKQRVLFHYISVLFKSITY